MPFLLLAGPLVGNEGSFIPNIPNVKVEGPSFPTFRASQAVVVPAESHPPIDSTMEAPLGRAKQGAEAEASEKHVGSLRTPGIFMRESVDMYI